MHGLFLQAILLSLQLHSISCLSINTKLQNNFSFKGKMNSPSGEKYFSFGRVKKQHERSPLFLYTKY